MSPKISLYITKVKNWLRPRIRRPKFWVLSIMGLIVLILIIRGIVSAVQPEQFTTMPVERADVVESVILVGRVRSSDHADLGFGTGGRIRMIEAQEGDMVKEGQELARLSLSDLYAELADARAGLALAQADADAGRLDVTSAQRSLQNLTREQNALVAQAYRELLTTDLQAYSESYTTAAVTPTISGTYTGNTEGFYTLDMYNSGALSDFSYNYSGLESGTESVFVNTPGSLGSRGLYAQFDEESHYGNTTWTIPIPNTRSSSYTSLKSAYDTAVATRDRVLATAQDDVDRIGVQENATTRSTRTQALIDQARARVDRARAAVAEGSIIAPFAGVVGSILFEAGEHVNSGETVLTLIGEGTYDIILDVPEIDIGKIIVGNDITASLDAYPDISWAGHITTISPSERYIDGVPVYSVTAVINNPDDRIRSGMSGRVFIETRRVSNVLAVPVSALTFKDKEVFVDTVQDGESITTPVMLGFRGSDGMVEVKEGLQEGDMIVVSDTKSSSP